MPDSKKAPTPASDGASDGSSIMKEAPKAVKTAPASGNTSKSKPTASSSKEASVERSATSVSTKGLRANEVKSDAKEANRGSSEAWVSQAEQALQGRKQKSGPIKLCVDEIEKRFYVRVSVLWEPSTRPSSDHRG